MLIKDVMPSIIFDSSRTLGMVIKGVTCRLRRPLRFIRTKNKSTPDARQFMCISATSSDGFLVIHAETGKVRIELFWSMGVASLIDNVS